MNLKNRYEKLCSDYIRAFVKKHDYEFSGWIGDEIGGIACFVEQYYFNLNDIVFDINSNLPVNLIFEWQEYLVDKHFKNQESGVEDVNINLRSYWKGMRL